MKNSVIAALLVLSSCVAMAQPIGQWRYFEKGDSAHRVALTGADSVGRWVPIDSLGISADGQGINLASNGLSTTTSGGDTTVILGGPLTQNTTIDMGENNIAFNATIGQMYLSSSLISLGRFGNPSDVVLIGGGANTRIESNNDGDDINFEVEETLDLHSKEVRVLTTSFISPDTVIRVSDSGLRFYDYIMPSSSPSANQVLGEGAVNDNILEWVDASAGGGSDGQGINLAANGLSTSTSSADTTVILGGPLTQNTTIEGDGFNLTIDSLAELEVQADTFRVSRGPNTLTGSIMSMEGESELINRNGKMTIYNPTDGYPGPVLISGTSGDRPILEILDGTNGNRATGIIRAAIAGAQIKMDKVGTVDITYDSLVFRGNAHVWTLSDDEAPSPTLGDTTVLSAIGTGSPGTARGKFVDINTIRARGPAFDGGSLYITTSNPDTIDYTGAGGTFFQIQDMTTAALDRFTASGDTLYYTRPLYERAFTINFHASFTANQSNTASALQVENNGTAIPGCRVEARYVTSGNAVTLSGSCRADLDDTAALTLALQIGSSAASEVVISYANLNVN